MAQKSAKKIPRKSPKRVSLPEKAVKSEPAELIETNEEKSEVAEFYIVGIGASAGRLEAFEEFFTHMPADSGIVLVIVSHFAPTHNNLMPDPLMKYTEMDVCHGRPLFVSICYHFELGSES